MLFHQKISFEPPPWRWDNEPQFDGCRTTTPARLNQNNKTQTIWILDLKRSLKCVFSHVPHLYLRPPPAFKVTVRVREHTQSRHWLTSGSQITTQGIVNIKLTVLPLHNIPGLPPVCYFHPFKGMTHTICVSHPNPHARAKSKAHTHARLHMQESKNSLRSSIKNRPEKIKARLVRLSLNALTVCLPAFGYLWRTQAEKGERRWRRRDGEQRVALQFCCLSSWLRG